MVKSRYIGDGHPTSNRYPYNGYINPYYLVDDHPLLYGNNRSLDPGTYESNIDGSKLRRPAVGWCPKSSGVLGLQEFKKDRLIFPSCQYFTNLTYLK